ncbi:hypothetical protein SAMN02799624_04236 [Paenibacillus sp. UNC496MF]|uniref:hypothetical protein n=1 Tax=Paenibacillus sp. UNC496MF TaxID=1502753 RepID=UPI0008E72559|nr:hypothetical protein [Paenibacillus sp. UNC496MF]SFJ35769.1 hypothetical protein SAMN02799624_04236 [Paenibacillus sp. UNC496MF]
MQNSLLRHWRVKRLKLRIWNRRLQESLREIAAEFGPSIACSVHVRWGPFFGGSMTVGRRLRRAKIMIQLPYDGYLTANERQVLSRYSLKKTMLPYFILYHEAAHLLEIMPYIGSADLHGLKRHVAAHRRLAAEAASSPSPAYRDLAFEEEADRYAYRMIVKNRRQAG